jgi:hypothetical protein
MCSELVDDCALDFLLLKGGQNKILGFSIQNAANFAVRLIAKMGIFLHAIFELLPVMIVTDKFHAFKILNFELLRSGNVPANICSFQNVI